MALRTVGVKLMADVSNYTANMRKATESTKSFGETLSQKASAGKLDAIANQAGVMGIGLAAGFGYAVKAAADFDKQMSAVSAATHANAGDLAQLRAAAIEAGKATQYSATEAAQGVTELAKAGVSTADILGGGLKGALSLAAAGQLAVGDAAETAASAMTQFKLKGDQIPHVADLLAAGAGKAQGSVADMSAALNQSGLIAAQTGLTIEDTTGTLAAFASAGLIGSDAGTSFKTMLQALQAPSGKTKDLMDDLGISAYDAQGSFIGITGLAGQLKDKLSKLTPELRANALAQIFGSDATRAASVLYEQGAEGIQTWIDKTNDAGYASVTAAKLTDNLAGDLERLKGSLETMAIEGGSGANSGLRVLVTTLGALVDQVGRVNPIFTSALVVVAGVTGALLLGTAGWIKYRAAIAKAQAELIAVGPAGERAAAALGKLTSLAGKVAVWSAAMEVGATALNSISDKSADVDQLTDSIQNLAATGQAAGALTEVFGADMKNFGRIATFADANDSAVGKFINTTLAGIPVVGDFGSAVGDLFNRLAFGTDVPSATADMAAYDDALTQVITSTNDYTQASKLWQQALQSSGKGTEELSRLLPNAYKKLGELNAQAESAAGGLGSVSGAEQKAAGQTQQMTDEMKKQADAAAALEKHLEDLFSMYMTADHAAIKLKETEIATNKEFKDGTRTLSLNTDEGRKNRSAVLDRLDAIESMREAEIKNGGSVDKANQKYRDQVGDLKKTLRQMSFNRTEIGKLIDKYLDIPGKVNTKITTSGGATVAKQLTLMGQAQQALKRGTQVPAPLRRAFNFAVGGWTGPGDTYDVAGVVHADEHVIRKKSRRKVEQQHPGLLDHINVHGELPPGYAGGGRVIWPFPVTVAMTRIPSPKEVSRAVTPAGGMTYRWIERAVAAAFPGMPVISDYRPGAVTLSGNRSYHAVGRAVDYPPSLPLAEWINAKYFGRTKELITPWNSLNIWNGRRHTYTGAIWNEHNFAGGNAHDHWAMRNGGTIREPIFGVGASGRTYSFGENYQPERVIPNWQAEGGSGGGSVTIELHNHAVIGSQYELDNWLAGSYDRLRRRSRVP